MTLDELRRRRDAVHAREEATSYRRRLLQAQLDLVEAAASAQSLEELDAMIAETLSDGPATSGGAVRAVAITGPVEGDGLEPLPDDLVGLADDERAALLERLRAEEHDVSERRRDLLDELDELQEELVRRFRRDGVDAKALLEGSD